jgi:hypothetical protein
MDLSIRVIALIPCVTEVTSHQDTHTYRLSKFLKNTPQTSTNTRQQQRNEIMKTIQTSVKRLGINLFRCLPAKNLDALETKTLGH